MEAVGTGGGGGGGGSRASKKRRQSKEGHGGGGGGSRNAIKAINDKETQKKKKKKRSSSGGSNGNNDASSSSSSSSSSGGSGSTNNSSSSSSKVERDVRGMSVIEVLAMEDVLQVNSIERGNMLLSLLLAPAASRQVFYSKYWETKPLVVARRDEEEEPQQQQQKQQHQQHRQQHLLRGLLTKKAITNIFDTHCNFYGADVTVSRVDSKGMETCMDQTGGGAKKKKKEEEEDEDDGDDEDDEDEDVEDGGGGKGGQEGDEEQQVEAKAKDLWSKFAQGGTLRLLCPQKHVDVLWSLMCALEIEFGCRVGCHAELTPPGTQGFVSTADNADSFILQLTGASRWMVYAPKAGEELLRFAPERQAQDADARGGGGGDDDARAKREATLNVVLRAGEVLYIPKGWVYSNKCLDGDEASLHLRLFTNVSNSVVDLLELILPTALEVQGQETLSMRKGLPRDYTAFLGVAHSEEEEEVEEGHVVPADARRIHFHTNIRAHLQAMTERALQMVDVGADRMMKKFIAERQPLYMSESEEANSASAAPEARIFPYTSLRMLRPGAAIALVEDGVLVVYHCMDNSRELYGAPLNPLEFELDDGPAIEMLLLAYPDSVLVSDLPHSSEEMEDKVSIAQALYKEGFLVIVDTASQMQEGGGGDGEEDQDGGNDSDDPF